MATGRSRAGPNHNEPPPPSRETGQDEVDSKPLKVNEVRQQFLVHGDYGLAHRLQNEEYQIKSAWNRNDRTTARKDVPLARKHYNEEEARRQSEMMGNIEQQQKIAEADKELALKLEQEDRHKKEESIRQADADALLAMEYQKEEVLRKRREKKVSAEEDELLAMRYQDEEHSTREQQRQRREQEDQELARQLQLNESADRAEEDAERDNHVNQTTTSTRRTVQKSHTTVCDTRSSVNRRNDGMNNKFSNYRLTHMDDVSDADRRNLCLLQDEEIAVALQEREKLKAQYEDVTSRDRRREMEMRDEQISRLIHEQEKLNIMQRRESQRSGRTDNVQRMEDELRRTNLHASRSYPDDNVYNVPSSRSVGSSSDPRLRSLPNGPLRHAPPPPHGEQYGLPVYSVIDPHSEGNSGGRPRGASDSGARH